MEATLAQKADVILQVMRPGALNSYEILASRDEFDAYCGTNGSPQAA